MERLGNLRHVFSAIFPDKVLLDFSVVICTYNGAKRLPDVLECLRWQLNINAIAWEIIVVDNNSTDNTAQIVSQFQQNWPRHYPLRYTFEPKQGSAYARDTGVRLAAGAVVGFLDDDNLPGLTWVSAAYKFAHAHPQAGAWASRIRGEFAGETPINFGRISAYLALTERGSDEKIYSPTQKILPPSAGLVVRRQAWVDCVPEHLALVGRIGKSMIGGEDIEAILHIQKGGWEVWYNPRMRVIHRIPASRLTRSYLINLCRGVGLSRYHTRRLSFGPWQRPLVIPLYLANDLRKLLTHIVKYRQATLIDTVTLCEMWVILGAIASPFFFWQLGLRRWLQHLGQTLSLPPVKQAQSSHNQ